MEDKLSLVKEAKATNSKIISMPRLLILKVLEELGRDGAAYRELRAGLELDDGVLYANLRVLCDMGYLEEKGIKVEKKELTSYNITDAGLEAFAEAKAWLRKL